jgi:hypothetical protein
MVTPVKALVSAKGRHVSPDVGEMYGAIRHQFFEVFHHLRLGQDRQFVKRTFGKPPVKSPVEGRTSVGMFAKEI